MNILVTGGAGFIGSALIKYLIAETNHQVLNIDKLTYAGNLESLLEIQDHQRYRFKKVDICDKAGVEEVFGEFAPDLVMHLAAESHVDRSIDGPGEFIRTNVWGTYTLLEAAEAYRQTLADKESFKFLHISTDEVYGSLGDKGLFTEETSYSPNSPYSASKASSDHLVRAWHETYGLPVVITNCSNNYGPCQFPEKLIPLMILNALEGKPLPVYGTGENVRDWLYVEDHVRALYLAATLGVNGETYNVGGNCERKNIEIVYAVCDLLDELAFEDKNDRRPYRELVTFVEDRPGHDLRYAIDASKIEDDLGWHPEETFESGLRKTVTWYLDNMKWCQRIQDGSYMRERLGTGRGS